MSNLQLELMRKYGKSVTKKCAETVKTKSNYKKVKKRLGMKHIREEFLDKSHFISFSASSSSPSVISRCFIVNTNAGRNLKI